jgi:hypothetical protein
MWNTAIATADTLLGYMPQDVERSGNTTQEVVIDVPSSREYMLASEKSLSAIWMTPEEDEAWKDL